METSYIDAKLGGGYWESRGLWFLFAHRGHWGVEIYSDSYEHIDTMEAEFTEVFKPEDDETIRNRVRNSN